MNNEHEVDILIVEDNATDAALTLRTLKKHGFAGTAMVVTDGVEALDFLFSRGSYSQNDRNPLLKLILLDLKLPMISGLEVLKEIKKDPYTKTIPVVILTSSSQERDILESCQLGANSYVVKPLEYDRFCETVAAVGNYWMEVNVLPFDLAGYQKAQE
jgi:two-component system, response regulator